MNEYCWKNIKDSIEKLDKWEQIEKLLKDNQKDLE
jgi:hypothetical protein